MSHSHLSHFRSLTPCPAAHFAGNNAYFMRYAEWLLSCPVILIHLSNLTGMKNNYSKRTMTLLVSCVGMIVFGLAGGLATGWLKVRTFLSSISPLIHFSSHPFTSPFPAHLAVVPICMFLHVLCTPVPLSHEVLH